MNDEEREVIRDEIKALKDSEFIPLIKELVKTEQQNAQTEENELLIDTINIRLEGISEATKRARLSFLVSTIASCAIIITLYNAYWSHSRDFAFSTGTPTYEQSDRQLPLTEVNRRALTAEWIKNTSVSINLLGLQINVNEFSILGSFALTIITFWLFFSLRRENRASVALLRDIFLEVRDSKTKVPGKGDWNIVNLTYQGIVHRNIFMSSPSNRENPLSLEDTFREYTVKSNVNNKSNVNPSRFERFISRFENTTISFANRISKKEEAKDINDLISRITIFMRWAFNLLLFLPVFTIAAIVFSDIASLFFYSPFRQDSHRLFMYLDVTDWLKVGRDLIIAIVFIVVNFIMCYCCLIFQSKTSESLTLFANHYGLNKSPEQIAGENNQAV